MTTRYVAQLFEAVGTDRIVTMDVHNRAAWDNAFRIPAEHLEARKLTFYRGGYDSFERQRAELRLRYPLGPDDRWLEPTYHGGRDRR